MYISGYVFLVLIFINIEMQTELMYFLDYYELFIGRI